MRKILSIFAALLVAIAVSANTININTETADALRLALADANDGDVIVMAAGTYLESNGDYIAFSGKSVTVKAAAGANVIIQPQVPIIITNSGSAKFVGVKIDASHLNDKATWYEHVIYANDATDNVLIMDSCDLYNFNIIKSAIYCSSSNKFASLTIENCYFHDIQRSCIFIEGIADAVRVANSTIANISNPADSYSAGIIDVRTTTAEVRVDHCTFYNCVPKNTDYAAVGKIKTSNAIVSNCIFSMPESTGGIRTIRDHVTANNCLVYNYTNDSGYGMQSDVTKNNCIKDKDPKFADAANGDFSLAEDSPAHEAGVSGTHLGDPRWWPASWKPAEVIEVTSVALDASELAIDVNESAFLHATVLPNDATDPSVSWTSSNNAIATVAGGVVKGIAAGTVTITAKAGAKTATCEVTVSDAIPSTDFSEPYFLKGTKAALEGNIYVSEADSLHYEDNSVCGTATWKINALKGAVIAATANYKVGSASGAKLRIVVLDEDENQVGDSLTQEYYNKDGDVAFAGSITLPAAGEYTIKLVNIQSWSSAKLRGITLTDVTPQRLYLKPAIWYYSGNDEKFAIWDITHSEWTAFMTLAEDETDIWTVTVPYNTTQVIFARFENSAPTPDWDGGHLWNKTYDLTLEEGKDMYTITAYGENYGPCPGEWSKYTHVEKPKFHISGSMTEWALIDSYADSYELDLKAGSYSLKVVTLENNWLGYAQLTPAYKTVELYPDEDDNVCFTLVADGKVTVTYIKDNVFKLEGDFVLPEIRLPGILSGLTLTPAENKLTASVTVELAANYGYSSRVVCATTWLGKAKNGDDYYEVTRDAATVDGLGWEGAEIIFRTDKAGNYTFTWTFATRELVVTYPDFDPEDGFYLVGTFDDVEEWGVESLNASKKFTWNKHIGEGNEEWKITVALHAGDRFKAVYVYRESIATWYPSGSGNDYVVDDNHAGASKTIYFQEKYNDEWGGHFYIEQNWPTAIDNSDAEIKVEKFFRDGQLIIRKNGVEYNAQGAIVK